MTFPSILNLLWIPILTIAVCSELYDFPIGSLLARSDVLTTINRHSLFSRAARSSTDRSSTCNPNGSTSILTATYPRKSARSATVAPQENAASNQRRSYSSKGLVVRSADPGVDSQSLESRASKIHARENRGAKQPNEKSSKPQKNFSSGITAKPAVDAGRLKQKEQEYDLSTKSKSTVATKETPLSRTVPTQSQVSSKTNGKGKVAKATGVHLESNTRNLKKPADEEDGRLCRRGKSGGCLQGVKKPKNLSKIPKLIVSTSSMELGKMRSFWQKNPGVFPPACLAATGVIITACGNFANAAKEPNAKNIVQAVGTGTTAVALGYGIVAGYNGQQAKDKLSPAQLKRLGDSLPAKFVQGSYDAYHKATKCIGKGCKAMYLDKAAACVGSACEYMGFKKPKTKGDSSTATSTKPSAEIAKTESAPEPVPDPKRHPAQPGNSRLSEEIKLDKDGKKLIIVPKKLPRPVTGAASSSEEALPTVGTASSSKATPPPRLSEIQPLDVEPDLEAGTMPRKNSSWKR